MNQREKTLLITILILLGLYGVTSFVPNVLLAPVKSRESRIRQLQSANEQKQDQIDRIMVAQKKLSHWKQQSLPPERLNAAALYQYHLLNMAEQAKFTSVNVDRNRIVPRENTFSLIGMTVTAKGTLKQVADFLFAFQRTDLLHKIKKIDLQSTGNQGDPVLEITINIEALSLNETDPREELFVKGREEAVAESMTDKTREHYAAITAHNMFVRAYNGPPQPKSDPKPAAPKSDKPGIDIAQHVFLVISVAKGSSRDAVLYNRTSNRETLLTEGKDFEVAGIQGRIVTIGPDFLTMKIKEDIWRLELGHNLRQIEKISSETPKTTDPSTASTQ